MARASATRCQATTLVPPTVGVRPDEGGAVVGVAVGEVVVEAEGKECHQGKSRCILHVQWDLSIP